MPTLYLFVGYPGSGKTTAANIICSITGAHHIWADQERQKMFGRPTHSVEESARLYDVLNRKAKELLESGQSVVFDTNFNYRRDRERLRNLAAATGAETVIIEMTTPENVARHRALAGQHAEKNGMHKIMAPATFERIVNHRQGYGEGETPIYLSGQGLNEEVVKQALAQHL